MKNFHRQQGFTLLEILVAAFITALIVVTAYQALNQAARDRQKIEARFDRMQQIQLAMRILTKDVSQIQPRPVRDLLGQGQLAAVMTVDSDAGIEMTVGGHANPLNLQRSQQQRIGYELEDESLFRSQWLVLDRTQGSVPARRMLLEGVQSMSVRFMNRELDWAENWPENPDEFRALPRALEITLEIDGVGLVRRVIEIAG